MSQSAGIPLSRAQTIAEELREKMAPFCEQICIAGSVRRRCDWIGDIEIVCVPKWESVPVLQGGLFGGFDETEPRTYQINALHSWATNESDLRWIKTGTSDIIDWHIKPDGKYWRALLPCLRRDGIRLDLFLATERNYGAIQLIRTGSAEFSAALMAHAKRINRRCEGGHFHIAEVEVETPTERSVFDLLGLEWVEPRKRFGARNIVRISALHAERIKDVHQWVKL